MKAWRDLSADPNDQSVTESRRAAIARARTPHLISDRIAYLCELVAGRSVLDIGIVEHTRDASSSDRWLHRHLKRSAKRCLGVDVLEPEVMFLKDQGYDVVVADITLAPLAEKFDVIIGGEVLEHLDGPGMFMKHCAAMLEPGGRLAITVPNPWYVNAILKSCARRETFVDSADHVAWYDASTLFELGQRHGLVLQRFTGIAVSAPETIRARAFFCAQPALIGLGFSPLLFAKSIIYEFVRV